MTDNIENDKKTQNDIELNENEVFEKIKEDLNPIQENLSEKKITIDEAKDELKRINEWIKWTNLEVKDKKEIWKAFEKLTKLEKNVDENTLKNEVKEIVELLESLTNRDLANLKSTIIHKHPNNERPSDVQKWIKESANNLDSTINEASEDKNPIARRFGKAMKWLNS